MKTHKLITYPDCDAARTSMHVLHSILPKLNISGFNRGRTHIFEDDCFAHITYRQSETKMTRKAGKKWGVFSAKNDNAPLSFTLYINIKPHNIKCETFHIYSNIIAGEQG